MSASRRSRVALGPVARVAAVAAVIVALLYAGLVALLVTLVSHRLVAEADARLAARISEHQHESRPSHPANSPAAGDPDDAPVYVWQVDANGAVTATRPGSPALPASIIAGTADSPRTARVGGADFRVADAPGPAGSRVVAAESLAQERHVTDLLIVAALVVSPILVGGAFLSAFAIGRQASKPIERARRQQLDFTADASHELRTPLTVIDAEVGLALAAERAAGSYRETLLRVAGESDRLRRIVEDLLWLARFDSRPPPPRAELIDVGTLVRGCAERFAPVVHARGLTLAVEIDDGAPARIAAPPEWIDRLVGVLLDNAARYAKPGGRVEVAVGASSGHVVVSVSDDGPGIPPSQRDRLFDRFHRLDDGAAGGGAGLGLAIADAVARSTQGRCGVGDSPLGGAKLTVTWPRSRNARSSRGRTAWIKSKK